jgi:hypothetical protein
VNVPVLPVISILGRKIVVYDTVETVVNGRSSKAPEADRDIFGVIQPTATRDLEILPEGDRTKGAITIHTKAELSIADSGTDRETYVRYRGKVYRVAGEGPWGDHGFRKYIATTWQAR